MAILLVALASVLPAWGSDLVIQNVTAIGVPGAASLPHATVVIRDDRIVAVGRTPEPIVPPGARVIDGSGWFLVPGFIDMHVHLSKVRASSLALFILNGVTTVRDMGGDQEELLRWRRQILAGARVGPRIVMAGPYLESTANVERMRRDSPSERAEPFERTRIGVGSPEEARRVVALLASRNVDFVKIRTVADRETYLALNRAAHAHGLKLAGHVTGIPPEVVLAAGQDCVEHGFYPTVKSGSRQERLALWRRFAARGVPVVPTMVSLFQSIFPPTQRLRAVTEDAEGKVDARRKYVAKYTVRDWREQVAESGWLRRWLLRRAWETFGRRDLREMHAAGMDLLVGTDTAVVNVFPGFSLHDEMALFVTELGMTPAEVLDRATRRPARLLGLGRSLGTIERGRTADLVLLSANPLSDIRNTRRIEAVIVGGKLYDHQALDRLRGAVLASPDLSVDDWGRR